MTMPPGQVHVAKALELAKAAREALKQLDGVDGGWKADADAKLDGSISALNVIADRFFLKTRLCVPFARRCEEAATALDSALGQAYPAAAVDAQQAVNTAVDKLVKVVRALDEQSQMKGMAIT